MEVIRVLIGDKWRQFTSLLLAGGVSAISYAYGIKVVHDTLTAENNMENILSVVVLITFSVGLSIFSGQHMNRLFETQIHLFFLLLYHIMEKLIKILIRHIILCYAFIDT